MLAWRDITQNIVHPHEFAVLRAMDEACCEALADELSYSASLVAAEQRKEAEAAAVTTAGRRRGKGR